MASRSRTYRFDLKGHGLSEVFYEWHMALDEGMKPRILELLRVISEDTPIVGFGRKIDQETFERYWAELEENVLAGKIRLMTMNVEGVGIIGLCNFRRNLNPNNGHIADLAKGMIDPRFRGAGVLPGAFLEICGQCRKDGVDMVTLDVRDESDAERIWSRFGFTTYGVLPDYSRANGRSYRGFFMYQSVADLEELAQSLVERYEGAA